MKAFAQLLCGLLILTLYVGKAKAEPVADNRFVVVVGDDVGSANDDPLRYAQSDAERFRTPPQSPPASTRPAHDQSSGTVPPGRALHADYRLPFRTLAARPASLH